MEGRMDAFRAGCAYLNALLADGRKVQLGVEAGDDTFASVVEADLTPFSGPHPAGNVGVHIHEVRPMNKGQVVWTVGMQDVANIGEGLMGGTYVCKRTIGLTGSRSQPALLQTTIGTPMAHIVKDRVLLEDTRVISGNVLDRLRPRRSRRALGYSSTSKSPASRRAMSPCSSSPKDGSAQVSTSSAHRALSQHGSCPKGRSTILNTNNNGEERAFVVTGQYDAVFPFDIYPVQLLKSILVGDIDRMEKLGIYEVAPEDFALCEYVCTSKLDVQDIVRKGLDQMIEEFA